MAQGPSSVSLRRPTAPSAFVALPDTSRLLHPCPRPHTFGPSSWAIPSASAVFPVPGAPASISARPAIFFALISSTTMPAAWTSSSGAGFGGGGGGGRSRTGLRTDVGDHYVASLIGCGDPGGVECECPVFFVFVFSGQLRLARPRWPRYHALCLPGTEGHFRTRQPLVCVSGTLGGPRVGYPILSTGVWQGGGCEDLGRTRDETRGIDPR